MLRGEQPGRGQHVVGSTTTAAPAARASRPRRGRPTPAARTAGDVGGGVVPEHSAGSDQQVDLAKVLAAALDEPPVRAEHHLLAPGVAAYREPDSRGDAIARSFSISARSTGTKAGSLWRALGRRDAGRPADVEPGALGGARPSAPRSIASRGRLRRCGSPERSRRPRGRARRPRGRPRRPSGRRWSLRRRRRRRRLPDTWPRRVRAPTRAARRRSARRPASAP